MSTDIATPASSSGAHRGLRLAAIAAAVLAACVVAAGVTTRTLATKRLREETHALAPPVVTLTKATPADSSYSIELPGRLQAYTRAPIHARVSGYLKQWSVDIGTPVKAGQLMAEIDAPDLDQELEQAQGALLTAKANATLATSTAIRWQQLFKTNSVSQQDLDIKNGDHAAKDAIVKSAEANVHRLQVLEGFKRIVAPFDGIVTERLADVGDLIESGSSSGRPLFTVSYTRKLRLYVNVPQTYAPQLKPGIQAQLDVPEHPGKQYPATVESSAQAVDPASGATLVQLSVDNPDTELAPGAFANVHFKIPLSAVSLEVPASAVIVDHSGVHIATLGADNRVNLKAVNIVRDRGDVIELSGGVKPSDRIIATPPDGLVQGDEVRITRASG